MVTVFVSFATEDFVTPAHDDVLIRLAHTLRDRGITGSFHVTGDLARTVRNRCRHDVIQALQEHEIGYHTNTHGASPFLAAVCEEKPWDEAVGELMATEARGVSDVSEVFERHPAYYVTEFVKAPQLIVALRSLGLDTLGFSGIPAHAAPFAWYCGSLCYGGPHLGVESSSWNPERIQSMKAAFDRVYEKAQAGEGDGVIKLFLHPYKLLYPPRENSWVSLNRIYREYDIHGDWHIPRLYDARTSECLYGEFEQIIDHVRAKDDVVFASTSETAAPYREARPRFVGLGTVLSLARALAGDLSYAEGEDRLFSPAEIAALIVRALAHVGEHGTLPDCVPVRQPLGPTETAAASAGTHHVSADVVLHAAQSLDRDVSFYGRFPAVIDFGGGTNVPLGAAVLAMAGLLDPLARPGTRPGRVAFGEAPGYPVVAAEPYFREDRFTKPSYPEGFTGRNLCQDCRLQSWTYRPARPRP